MAMDMFDALRAVCRQADRYLVAAEQDQDPAIGLVHASYSQAGYGLLGAANVACADRKGAATAQQERWASVIRRCFGGGAVVAPLASAAVPPPGSGRDILAALQGVGATADRNLVEAERAVDPAVGLVRSSYAQAGYELLMVAGLQSRDRMAAAGRQQDRWGSAIRQCFGKGVTPSGVVPMPAGLPEASATKPTPPAAALTAKPIIGRFQLLRLPSFS